MNVEQLKTYLSMGLKIYFRPGTSDEDVLSHSFENDIFLSNLPEYKPAPHHTIIDVGAHIGTFSMLMCSRVPLGSVHAIEASKETFSVLEANKKVNRLSNLHLYHQAIAGKSGTVELYHDLVHGNWGHSITKKISEVSEVVEANTLELFMKRNDIKHVDLVKFNCEGAEFEIILNTPLQVLKNISCMLVLYHEEMVEKYKAIDIENYLKAAGFRVVKRFETKDPPRGWLIAYRPGKIKRILEKCKQFVRSRISFCL